MKILHINSYFASSKFFKNLYDNQVKSGLNIDVYIPLSTDFASNSFDYGEYSTISKNHNKYDRYIFHHKHHKIYKDIVKNYSIEDYTITHAHSLFSNGYIAMKLKEKYGIPYIVAVRNTDLNIFFKKMVHLRKLGIKILKEASHIIFLSKPYRKHVLESYIAEDERDSIYRKTSIIPNGIDDFWFKNLGRPKEQPIMPNLSLLQIGDIDKNKNVDTTIKSIDILNKKGYKIKLDLVGKIKDKEIFKRIDKLNYVNYLGYKSKEELIKIYRKNHIFILPSIHETFGLVYAEAMSQGLPLIYTRGQGFDGQFEEGEVGYAVDSNDPNDIAEKIINLTKDYEEISKRTIEYVQKFDWERISNTYNDLYIRNGV